MATVLAILPEGFEEVEAITPIDLLRRAGVEVTTAALSESMHVTGRSGLTMHADATLTAVAGKAFDMIFIPGGPGVSRLRADVRIVPLLQAQAAKGQWIAAICAAPAVLKDAGLLTGKRFTAHFSVASELPGLEAGERVIQDGRLITSRGAGTALDFGLALVAALTSDGKRAEVAAAICA